MTRPTYALASVLAALLFLALGLWLGGGRRVPASPGPFREPYDPEYEVTGV